MQFLKARNLKTDSLCLMAIYQSDPLLWNEYIKIDEK